MPKKKEKADAKKEPPAATFQTSYSVGVGPNVPVDVPSHVKRSQILTETIAR